MPVIPVTEDEKIAFRSLCETVKNRTPIRQNIGTYKEKQLHATLKRFCEPVSGLHEKKIGNYTVDIFNEEGVVEIQTGSFYPMHKKLETLLPYTNVRIVHPLCTDRRLIWIDPETGETTKPRRSPHHADVYDCARDFYWIRDLLGFPSLTVELLFLECDEYRLRDGWGNGGKRGSHREMLIPRELVGRVVLHGKADYDALLPSSLPDPFTVGDLSAVLRRSYDESRYLVKTWLALGTVTELPAKGRKKLYSRAEKDEPKRT